MNALCFGGEYCEEGASYYPERKRRTSCLNSWISVALVFSLHTQWPAACGLNIYGKFQTSEGKETNILGVTTSHIYTIGNCDQEHNLKSQFGYRDIWKTLPLTKTVSFKLFPLSLKNNVFFRIMIRTFLLLAFPKLILTSCHMAFTLIVPKPRTVFSQKTTFEKTLLKRTQNYV